ncbi:hypothetical protein EN780_03305 [Mesorhizobium sp. M4B.F.Ca.ET.089.01.1.1]|uniref:hypothetical protein n=1 Tax=Mesorhizobium sp. M4B.F.Ca.ET.089.01.1.1 TaxID=2496662 RepID=UPI000FE3FD1B|nr:hypothetical protein [Mesorhizobium sp. M4B.F.Ca.ET.089.01.1.1]RWX70435.1 hypothetical protein EN780_03305 [Mesorhizobium sp. M4B.F.Ca.ET.089.01.1.1]
MAIMTKAQHAKHERLRAARDNACNAVYAAGPNRQTVFSECLKLAADATRLAWQTACADLDAFENQMIADCRAYRGSLGMFTAYWR